MNNHIAHVKKDIWYHQDLCTGKQALLPANSPYEIELTDADLEAIHGGADRGTDGDKSPLGDLRELLHRLPLQQLPVRSSLLES